MRAWLIGGDGRLGQALQQQLLTAGVPYLSTGLDVDLRDSRQIDRFAAGGHFSHIFNLAAYTAVDLAEAEPEAARALNVDGAETVARAALATGAHLVHVSTDYVFGGDLEATPVGTPIDESRPTAPVGVYGQTKWEGEQAIRAVRAAASDSPQYWIVRTAWLFGNTGTNFVDTMVRAMLEREEIRVVDDQVGSPTYTADLARMLVAISGLSVSRRPPVPSGTYHAVNEGAATWFELAQAIAEEMQTRGMSPRLRSLVPIDSSELARPAPRPRYSALSTRRLQDALGFAPRHWRSALHAHFNRIALGSTPT